MHLKARHILNSLQKRAKIFPVLGILGVRQVGKSTFLLEQWQELQKAHYITFDKKEIMQRAINSPEHLLLSESDNQTVHLIIDEAQKVPHIFDSIKAIVDQDRKLGAFTLSGSTDFSGITGVRESLAGRIGISKLYPLTLREITQSKFVSPWVSLDFNSNSQSDAKTIEKWLERGGMPTFCKLSDEDERMSLINSWIEVICYRDLQQLQGAKYNSDVAYNILIYLAANSDQIISIADMANAVKVSSHTIKHHLNALESLFIIYKIPSFDNPHHARPKYMLFDSGVLNTLRPINAANWQARHANLVCLLINEIYAQYEYSGKLKPKLFYYRTRGGAAIDLVLQTKDNIVGIECLINDDVSEYRQRGMKSFLENFPTATGYFIAPIERGYKINEKMQVISWNSIG